ncbi:MAG: sugar phosphate isomerase/epimerase [Bacteroidetes bacterium]|nr:sugar phosphate isomerase/epimerase [Bacteroidota bacterium]
MKRREFVKTSAAAAVSTLIIPGCTMSKANEEIGLQIYTIRHELEEDLTGTLKKVSEIGYRKLEGAGYRDGLYFGLPPKEFKNILDDNDLYLISGHVNTGRKEPDLKGTMTNQFELAIEHAQLMGQKYLVLAYLESFERESIKDYYDLIPLINRCAEIAKDAGIQFGYHNHDFELEPLDGELPYDVLLNELPTELVFMELDLYWAEYAGVDPIAIFEKDPGRFKLWHVKDMDDTPERGKTEVGNGVIDFDRIFRVRDRAGLEHFFVEQDDSKRSPLESIEISYKYVSNLLN